MRPLTALLIVVLNLHLYSGMPIKLVSDLPRITFALLDQADGDQNERSGVLAKSLASVDLSASSLVDEDSDDSDSLDVGSSPGISKNNSTKSLEIATKNDTSDPSEELTYSATDIATLPLETELSVEVNDTRSSSSGNRTRIGTNSSSIYRRINDILAARWATFKINLPNGQSYQYCDEKSSNADEMCEDTEAKCEFGACVCRDGYIRGRDGFCEPIDDLLKNCENDHQCQALNVHFVCDFTSHEHSVCNCAEGLYFDLEAQSCLSCLRNILIVSKMNPIQASNLTSNQTQYQSANSTAAILTGSTKVRPCARELQDFSANRLTSFGRHKLFPTGGSVSSFGDILGLSGRNSPPTSTPNPSNHHSNTQSDPFKIRLPLQVFMGAMMLFTMVLVAWFLLQRMIHDCRAIFRSIRHPDYPYDTTTTTLSSPFCSGPSQGYLGQSNRDYFGLASTNEAVARLLTIEPHLLQQYGIPPSIFTRDLAGVLVQHLAANMSPSSTNQAIAAVSSNGPNSRVITGTTGSTVGPDAVTSQEDATSANSQARNAAAAAAAAQLLMQPSHPAFAILRAVDSIAAAAAAQLNGNGSSDPVVDPLGLPMSSLIDPPPKYEEAIARQTGSQTQYLNQAPPYSVVVQSNQGNGPPTSAIAPAVVQQDMRSSPSPSISISMQLSPPPPSFQAATNGSTVTFEFDTQSSNLSTDSDATSHSGRGPEID